MSEGYAALYDACVRLDTGDISTVNPLVDALDAHSKTLAVDIDHRTELGHSDPSIWPQLLRLWTDTARAHTTADDADMQMQLRRLCHSLARFTRNLVAAVPSNQDSAFENEPAIRELVKFYTSYSSTQDPQTFPVARILVQTLSNLVTSNEDLMTRLWESYMNLTNEESILLRLLHMPDSRTIMSTFVLILNCVQSSEPRACVIHPILDSTPHSFRSTSTLARKLLVSSSRGPKTCVSLLDSIATLFDEEGNAASSQAFDIGYHIFCVVAEFGLVPRLYDCTTVDSEVVTPHQTTLLKLLDSYLQPSQAHKFAIGREFLHSLCDLLLSIFFSLTTYVQKAIRSSLGLSTNRLTLNDGAHVAPSAAPNSTSSATTVAEPLNELDLLLPKVSEALILVTQCLISLALASEDNPHSFTQSSRQNFDSQLRVRIADSVSAAGTGLVESLIETLQLLDRFLPRITLGRVAPPPVPVEDTAGHHAPPSTEAQPNAQGVGRKGFTYLKRDLVRLLGIIASGRREIQNRVRACGGIPVVLNLCVVDERNPYLREHAIFTLRNLLHGNTENQALVNEIQPLREWDEKGELQTQTRAR